MTDERLQENNCGRFLRKTHPHRLLVEFHTEQRGTQDVNGNSLFSAGAEVAKTQALLKSNLRNLRETSTTVCNHWSPTSQIVKLTCKTWRPKSPPKSLPRLRCPKGEKVQCLAGTCAGFQGALVGTCSNDPLKNSPRRNVRSIYLSSFRHGSCVLLEPGIMSDLSN